MKRLILSLSVLLIPFASASAQSGQYYVNRDTLAEMSAPGGGSIVNRIYYGQGVTVSGVTGKYARVTEPKFVGRWVEFAGLSKTRPAPKAQKLVPKSQQDPRIGKDAIPKVGDGGLSQRDVDILWRGANYFLKTGKCSRVELANKSTSRTNTYYVNCGGPQNIFFTEADLK
jgi:hypothetical protein